MDTDDFCSTACEFCGDYIREGQPVHSGWTRGTPARMWPSIQDEAPPREVTWCDRCEDREGLSLALRHVVTATHRCACDRCQLQRARVA